MVSFEQQTLKTKFGKAVLWITLFSMAGGSLIFSPIFKRFGGGGGAPQIGTINDIPLTILQFKQKVAHEAERIEFLRQQMGPRAELMMRMMGLSTNPQEIAIQTLITDSLLDQVVEKMNIQIPDDVVGRKIQEPMFVINELRDIIPFSVLDQNGAINQSSLRYYLQVHGIPLADFEQSLVKGIARILVRHLITMSAYISKDDLKQAFEQRYLPRDYSVLTLELDSFVKKARSNPASAQELKNFFDEQNRSAKRYWAPEKRTATIVEFNPEQFGIELSDADIERYYQEHKSSYIESPLQVQIRRIQIRLDQPKARETIEMIKNQLNENPAQFADLAKQYSQDSSSAAKGGLLGFFKKGDLDPIIERAAFRLQNDNDISDIVQTENSFEIIQRAARKPTTYKQISVVRNEIKNELLKERFDELFSKEARSAVNQMRNNPASVSSFIKNRSGIEKSATVNKKDTSALAQRIFKTPVDEWTYNVNSDGNGILIKTVSVEKSAEQPMDRVQKNVEDDFYQEKGRQLLKEALAKIEKSSSVSLATLKNELGGTLETTGKVSPSDAEAVEKLEKKKWPLRDMFNLSKPGNIAVKDQGERAYVIKLEKSTPFDQALFDQKKSELKAQLIQEQQELIYQGYIASCARNATIKLIQESEYQDQKLPLEDLPL